MANRFDFGKAFGTTPAEPTEEEKKVNMTNGIASSVCLRQMKIQSFNRFKAKQVEDLFDYLPLPGECMDIVSNGSFDYFTIIPHILRLADAPCTDFYFTTWTMNHNNVLQILDLYDDGIFQKITALTGEYFRTRESAVYFILNEGLKERGMRLHGCKMHAKVTLLQIGENYYVITGSANFTANPRVEQFFLYNDKKGFDLHKKWIEDLLIEPKKKKCHPNN